MKVSLCKHVFYKMIGKNMNECPEWHAGAVGKAWIFADEIIVN